MDVLGVMLTAELKAEGKLDFFFKLKNIRSPKWTELVDFHSLTYGDPFTGEEIDYEYSSLTRSLNC